MEVIIGTYSLAAATIMLLIIVSRGTYEYLFNMPKWFADPPASFEVIRQLSKNAAKFWIPVQLVFFISYFTTLISNWHLSEVKNFIIYAGLSYLVVIVSTAAYYVKEVMAFQKMPPDAPKTKELLSRVDLWYKSTIARNILQFMALILILVATYKIFTL